MLIEALTVPLLSGADRLRGSNKVPSFVGRMLFAVVATFAIATPYDDWWAALCLVLIFTGSTAGWGNPIGRALLHNHKHPIKHSKYESWQVGFLKKNVPLALFVRGLIWTGPLALLWYPTGNTDYLVASLAMPLAFTVSPYIPAHFFDAPNRWAPMEYIRGAIFGTILAVL
jgi:hypothetical protein